MNEDEATVTIEIGSILGARTKKGMVNITVGPTSTLMALSKAREVQRMLAGAIEAAVSDECVATWLTKGGFKDEHIAAALLDLREIRQGSRATVYES